MDDLRSRAKAFVHGPCIIGEEIRLIDRFIDGEPWDEAELQKLSVGIQAAQRKAASQDGEMSGPTRDALAFYRRAAELLKDIKAEVSPTTVLTVLPSVPRLIGYLVLCNLLFTGGALLVFGPRSMVAPIVGYGAGALSAIIFVIGLVMQIPRVVITPEGFTSYQLFGSRSYRWEDVDGRFAVIAIGLTKAVAFKLTEDYKAKSWHKRGYGLSGYDASVPGAYKLSAQQIATLLDEHRRGASSIGQSAPAVPPATTRTAPSVAVSGTQAEGNGSPIVRVAAGIMAALFAAAIPLTLADEELARRNFGLLVGMAVLGGMFGWYAVRGRRGLPDFFVRKLGSPPK